MNTILFDLDGTLLPMDLKHFEKLYFHELGKALQDMISPQELIKLIWGSTEEMVRNTDHKTNQDVFMEDFAKRVNEDISLYMDRFDRFYNISFDNVREAIKDAPLMRESVKILKEKGYDIVLATNPLFPLEAIHKRIIWAGFQPEDFKYISTFERNHYCKPQIKYYQEVLEDINKAPEDCLMVGNDVQEDLVAGKLGIRTFLITDYMINRDDADINSDYTGTYDDFYEFAKSLPNIN